MVVSLLLFSAPVLLVIADALLPFALLSASLSPDSPLSLQTISSHLRNYDFPVLSHRHTPNFPHQISCHTMYVVLLMQKTNTGVIVFAMDHVYQGDPIWELQPSVLFLRWRFVSLKASFAFGDSNSDRGGYVGAMEVALFLCSLGLGIGHVVVAYRTSCRERRKLMVYKIDIEAVSACKNGFPRYHKILQQEKVKQEKSEK
ncbi:alpha/beta hydrolase related protein [Actinidia rufa]|uniref:Alpha/beta hydrolase related protein n=1 Tax=Actinidia rufa TaxID=165716 RepID=A0A7J0EAS6_9ERIC|nr:alpha/beta hydrolase related protein [Actinidia rufa]